MRLRRVTVTGFKTFARRTEVQLEAGITAVVGPNGSGKSNLVDALRWVLGETSARELRGARMDEVIHAGGQGRAPLGMAQVDLVLDNEEGRLPVDGAEVQLTRRVTRGGDSEYRLNGARCRLRDLERTLSATGLTQSGYAVVAQNDVDGIIEATPAQRRALVEEAAGVRGLRSARDDALFRVGGVETRLLRLVDLLADAEPRLAELAVQATAAEEQRVLAGRLAELRGGLAREEWRAARGRARRARARLDTARGRAEAAREAELGFAGRLTADRERLAAARARRDALLARLESLRLAAERAAGERLRHHDRAAAAGLQRAAAAAEEGAATREATAQAALATDLGGAGAAAGALLERLAGEGEALAAAEADALRALREAEALLARHSVAAAGAARAADAAAARVREAETRVTLLEEAAVALVAAVENGRARVVEAERRTADATVAAEAASGAAEAAAAGMLAAEGSAAAARSRLAAAETDAARADSAHREAEARAAALQGRMAGMLGAAGAVAAAVAAGSLDAVRLLETVTVVDPADGAAVEAALEDTLRAWVVEDPAAVAAGLTPEGGREVLLRGGMGSPEPAPTPAGCRPVLDAVRVDAPARGALALLLERAWLAPDLTTARAAVDSAGGRCALPDGTVVTAAGLVSGGRPGEALALTAAARAAAAAVVTARRTASEAAAAVRDAAEVVERRSAELAAARAAADEARAALGVAVATAAGLRATVAGERDRLGTAERDLEGRTSAIATARAAVAECVVTAGSAVAASLAAATEVATAEEVRAARAAALGAAAAAVRAHELAVARAEPEAREVQRRLTAARTAAEQAEQRARVAELHRCGAEEAALAAVARAVASGRRAARVAVEAVEVQDGVATATGPVAALEATVDRLETERSEVAVAIARATDEFDAATAELTREEATVTALASALRAEDLDEGAPEPDAAAAERAEREIVRLERRVAALGPVNGLAPEQHTALAGRVGRLRTDHDDLAAACVDLRALADHLHGEIEGRFDAVFGAVAWHFRQLFEELFPGGRATLRLQEPEAVPGPDADGGTRPVRAPGVEILAQPAGKRLQALSLLSGGERALTALAVILALQQVNPSPFYVFDEVDAPLDDANVQRFVRLLRRLATQQQFLVVTHNHATMAAADALYGVTMGGDGVSRLLSVRFVAGEQVPAPYRSTAAAAAS